MKKWITATFVVMLMLLVITATAENNERTSGDFQYIINGNGTVTITGYTGEHKDIILPGLIEGYAISTIGKEAFCYGNYSKAQKEISITLPSSITTIEEGAFKNRNIRSVNLPNSLEYIGPGAFAGCSYDIQYRFSGTHPVFAVINGSLYNKNNKELLAWGHKSTIPEGIRSIGAYSFFSMVGENPYVPGNSVVYLSIPSTVTKIGKGAFQNTKYITIRFNSDCQITEIPSYAFGDDFRKMESCDREIDCFPQDVRVIGDHAFSGADLDFNNHHINTTVTSLGSFLKNVEEIGAYAFSYCYCGYNAVGITIPQSCKVIGEGAFSNFRSEVAGISLANGVERIETKAFQIPNYNVKFQSVYLPASLTYIADDAFTVNTEFEVELNSYAQRWAERNAYSYKIRGQEDDLSWLN